MEIVKKEKRRANVLSKAKNKNRKFRDYVYIIPKSIWNIENFIRWKYVAMTISISQDLK